VHSRSFSTQRTEVFRPSLLDNIDKLEALARRNGVSIQAIFLAAYATLHSRVLYGTDVDATTDVIFGIYLANRSHSLEGLPELAAPTVNLVPIRVKAPLQRSLLAIAKGVQTDLQEIGQVENSGVGLWEIEEWTGVKIDCFINFLKLPDAAEDDTAGVNIGDKIRIVPVPADWENGRRKVTEEDVEGFREPHALVKNPVKNVYLPSIDIEASVNAKSLDVGVFGPTSMLSLGAADALMGQLKDALEAI